MTQRNRKEQGRSCRFRATSLWKGGAFLGFLNKQFFSSTDGYGTPSTCALERKNESTLYPRIVLDSVEENCHFVKNSTHLKVIYQEDEQRNPASLLSFAIRSERRECEPIAKETTRLQPCPRKNEKEETMRFHLTPTLPRPTKAGSAQHARSRKRAIFSSIPK